MFSLLRLLAAFTVVVTLGGCVINTGDITVRTARKTNRTWRTVLADTDEFACGRGFIRKPLFENPATRSRITGNAYVQRTYYYHFGVAPDYPMLSADKMPRDGIFLRVVREPGDVRVKLDLSGSRTNRRNREFIDDFLRDFRTQFSVKYGADNIFDPYASRR